MADDWPAGVRPIGLDNIHRIGVDAKNKLYWDGKPVAVSFFSSLSIFEKITAFAIGFSAIAGGIGGAAQGWAAYNQWACDVRPSWIDVCKVK